LTFKDFVEPFGRPRFLFIGTASFSFSFNFGSISSFTSISIFLYNEFVKRLGRSDFIFVGGSTSSSFIDMVERFGRPRFLFIGTSGLPLSVRVVTLPGIGE
jgi:hypothetical protein